MTKLLEQAIATARMLSPTEQDDIARAIMQLAGAHGAGPAEMSEGERAAIVLSKAAAARGEFASDDEVHAVWAKHGQ